MVKIPSFDDLKKMGTGLVDSARSGKISGMVDKLKSGIESVTAKKPGETAPVGDEGLKLKFQMIYSTLKEFGDLQSAQVALLKKFDNQLSDLARVIEAMQVPADSATQTENTDTTTVNPESTTSDQSTKQDKPQNDNSPK